MVSTLVMFSMQRQHADESNLGREASGDDDSTREPTMRIRGALTKVSIAFAGVLWLGFASIAFAGGGNSTAAHRCQMGGWATLEDASGAPFADQSACVSYAAGGGQVYQPSFHVSTVTGTGLRLGSYNFSYQFTGSGFHADSPMTLTFAFAAAPYDAYDGAYPALFSTGGTGSFASLQLWWQRCGINAGDIVTGTITATDSFGVEASSGFTGVCSTPLASVLAP